MRRSVLRKTPCRVGRQYKGFASLATGLQATGLQATCSPLDFLLRNANVSTLISVSGNEREYHCSRLKVRLRHCRPPCSIRCKVASVACSFSKVRLRLVILPGSCPEPAGWLNISYPELTAVDMIAYQEHIGGLTRAATVLEELSLKLDFTKLDADFLKVASAPVFQRLGYLLDCVLGEEAIADGLHAMMKAGGMKMKAVPFRLGASVDDAEVDKKWKVMVNLEIEIDDL